MRETLQPCTGNLRHAGVRPVTFALFTSHPDYPDLDACLPLVGASQDDANLAGFALSTQGRLTGLCCPDGPLNRYLVVYNHNGPRLTSILASSIEQADRILAACLEDGIVEQLDDT
jgi:hypothetical protein